MKRYIVACLLIIFSVSIVAFCLQSKWYIKNPTRHLPNAITAELSSLGDSALLSGDVPVSALLLYDDTIAGIGYNTVKRENAAAGHAEINAISAVLRRTGLDSFMKLDREKLTLVTTWEPCAMCKGAIVEYNIKHVVVMKIKPLAFWWRDFKRTSAYEWQKQVSDVDSLQETLFKKHPAYNYEQSKSDF